MDKRKTLPIVPREHVWNLIKHLDQVRADLEAIAAGLRLSEDEEELKPPLSGEEEMDAVIRCGVHDHLRPLIASLRDLVRYHPEEER